jgi:hypothetical protein
MHSGATSENTVRDWSLDIVAMAAWRENFIAQTGAHVSQHGVFCADVIIFRQNIAISSSV